MSAGVDGVVKLWNIKKQVCVGTVQMHEEKVWAIDLSKGEKYLLTGGGDSTIKLWRDNTAEQELEDKEK